MVGHQASWPLLLAVLAVALAWRQASVRASRWLWQRPRIVMAGLLGAAALGVVWVVFVWLPPWFVPAGTIVLSEPVAWNLVAGTLAVLLGVALVEGRLGASRSVEGTAM